MSVRTLAAVRRTALWTVLTTTALGGLLFACDEVYADPVTAPFSSFFGTADSGLTSTRTPPFACTGAPEENSPCIQPNAVCEQGQSPDSKCNTLFVCANDSQFGAYWTEQTAPSCNTICPDPSQIVDGAPCELGDAGGPEAELHCTTSLGTCACTTGRDGTHAHARKWVCTKPAASLCPPSRPMLGQPCSGQRSCDYGSCVSKRGMRMICEDDVWQTEVATCE